MNPIQNRMDFPLKKFLYRGIALRDLLLIGLLFTLAMDFRRAEGDTGSFVIIMGLANFAFGAALIILERFHKRKTLLLMTPVLVFALSSSLVGILRQQAPFAVLAQALPAIIFAQTTLVCANYPRNPAELSRLLTLIVISGLAAAAWKLYFAFDYFGLDLSTVRYQVLSGASALLFGYALAGFLTESRKYMWPALAMSLGVVFVAVTRTYVVMFAASGLITLLALPSSQTIRLIKRIVVLLLALIGVLFVLQFSLPELSERWTQRLFSYREDGVDITTLTRIAETRGQLQKMEKDPSGLIFGFGMLASVEWTGQEMDILRSILGINQDEATTGYGHNFYIGSIFVGGLIFGLPMLFVLISPSILIIPKLRRVWKDLPKEEKFAGIFSLSASISYLGYGLLGGTLGDRSIAFYFGIAMGLQLRFLARNHFQKYSGFQQ